MSDQANKTPSDREPPAVEITRPLYLKRVPESVWIKVHQNALNSRLRLSTYLVKLMAESEPFPPQPPSPSK